MDSHAVFAADPAAPFPSCLMNRKKVEMVRN